MVLEMGSEFGPVRDDTSSNIPKSTQNTLWVYQMWAGVRGNASDGGGQSLPHTASHALGHPGWVYGRHLLDTCTLCTHWLMSQPSWNSALERGVARTCWYGRGSQLPEDVLDRRKGRSIREAHLLVPLWHPW